MNQNNLANTQLNMSSGNGSGFLGQNSLESLDWSGHLKAVQKFLESPLGRKMPDHIRAQVVRDAIQEVLARAKALNASFAQQGSGAPAQQGVPSLIEGDRDVTPRQQGVGINMPILDPTGAWQSSDPLNIGLKNFGVNRNRNQSGLKKF